jgi:predicted nucleic acid-binding protein
MMVVIDTNELLRMAAARDMSPLFAAWRANRFDLALSSELLAEMPCPRPICLTVIQPVPAE